MHKIEPSHTVYILPLFWSYVTALIFLNFKMLNRWCFIPTILHFISFTNSPRSQLMVRLELLLPVDVFARFYIGLSFTSVQTGESIYLRRVQLMGPYFWMEKNSWFIFISTFAPDATRYPHVYQMSRNARLGFPG